MEPTEGTPLVWAQAILEGLPDAVVAIDRDERIVFVNARAEELFGYARDELVGGPVQRLWPERVRERYTRNMRHYFATAHPLRFSTEAFGLCRDGSEFVGEMSWGVARTGDVQLLLAIGRDVTARRAIALMSERALAGGDPARLAADAEELLRNTLPVAGAWVHAAGEPPEEATMGIPIGGNGELLLAPTRPLTDDELTTVHAVASILSTALSRLRDEERMRHDALHDPLTGLANRTLLRDRLGHAVAQASRGHGETCVLFVDLDDFKRVNDAHGHQIGDELLATLGGRLLGAVRPADTVARIGGDEFVVVCEQMELAGALVLADRLEAAIEQPIRIHGHEYRLSASIGVAHGHEGAEALLRAADMAVYRAKAAGGARVEVF